MANDTVNQGECPKCRATNSYRSLNCIGCGARLPWADAFSAAKTTSAGTGAESEQERYYRRANEALDKDQDVDAKHAEGVKNVGAWLKVFFIIPFIAFLALMLIVFFFNLLFAPGH